MLQHYCIWKFKASRGFNEIFKLGTNPQWLLSATLLQTCKHYHVVDNGLTDNGLTGPPSYIKQSKFICLYVVPFEQERAHASVSSYGINYVHCFKQSQHLLIQIDLFGVVTRFGTAKYLCLNE